MKITAADGAVCGLGVILIFFLYFVIFFSITMRIFFFNDTATTEIYTLSLHDALPISCTPMGSKFSMEQTMITLSMRSRMRSEEHTSELQSQSNLVCRLLLEKKKK